MASKLHLSMRCCLNLLHIYSVLSWFIPFCHHWKFLCILAHVKGDVVWPWSDTCPYPFVSNVGFCCALWNLLWGRNRVGPWGGVTLFSPTLFLLSREVSGAQQNSVLLARGYGHVCLIVPRPAESEAFWGTLPQRCQFPSCPFPSNNCTPRGLSSRPGAS